MSFPRPSKSPSSNALKMELPYPLALQIVTHANNNLDIRDHLNVHFQSALVHCFSVLQLLVHKKQ